MRRNRELTLGLFAVLITLAGYVLVGLADRPDLPPDLWAYLAMLVGLLAVAHLGVRRFAPQADSTILPLVALLTGLGFVTISRLDRALDQTQPHLAQSQALWAMIGVAAFVFTLMLVRRVEVLARYRYTFLVLGIASLLLPLAPGVGREINGARLWVQIGPLTFQPGEVAKVLLVIFLAAYLAEKHELLSQGTIHFGRLTFPDPKHLGPLLLAWALSLVIMILQKDLGSSLLFFSVFGLMLYMATARFWYLFVTAVLGVVGSFVAYRSFDHVQVRVTTWLDPWPDAQGKGYQLVQSLFAFGTGGFSGTGLGLGSPQKIPNAATDFVFASIGEELGLLGSLSVIIVVLLLVGTGFRIAIRSRRTFSKLFAAGLASVLGIQSFLILGGVTRLIPLTGITLPFVSYGGSSLVANFVIVALLIRMSDEANRDPAPATSRRTGAAAR